MTSEADPIIDEWYHHPEKAQKFKVTALDEHTATIEVQYFDGSISRRNFGNSSNIALISG